jgi:IS5 family transposase
VEVVLRLLVVKHWYGWSYEQPEQFVGDSVVLRQFCRLYLAPVPDDTTLLRWANLIQPVTLHRLLDGVTELARMRQVMRGRKLRLDSMVVETEIHHPSDSTLLADSVRVLSRLVRRAKAVPDAGTAAGRELWRDRTRAAKRLARRIGATMVHQKEAREQERRALYARLFTVARASRHQAARVRRLLEHGAAAATDRLRATLDRFLPLVERVIDQAERRVLRGERVPAGEKVLSLFEPHTAVVRRGKARQPTEFGAKIVLDDVESGLVTRYTICAGNADDALSLPEGLTHHQRCFGRAPDLLTADRHFYSGENCRLAAAAGVRRVVLPKRGQPGRGDAAR